MRYSKNTSRCKYNYDLLVNKYYELTNNEVNRRTK